MRRILLAASLLLTAGTAFADDPAAAAPASVTKATLSISGLHCPPCTRVVESSLQRQKGVKAAKVDWATKSAKVEFDESVVPAQRLAAAVASTPHMMGGGMSYGSWLALSVPDIKDETSAKKAEMALHDVKGLAKVSASAKQHTLSVQFAKEGNVSSKQLIDALDGAGLKASNY